MKKNYLNEGMKLLLVGICLVLAAAFSETAVDGLLWGFAGGALAPGIARIIQHFYWSAPKNQVRYQEMKEQADINLHDELNEKLRDKSGRIAYLIGLLIICISEVVFSILGNAGIISNSVCAAFSSDRDWKSGISAVKKKILIDEQLEALQKELLKKANAKQGFEELADEIDALREEKQDLLVEEANRAGMK